MNTSGPFLAQQLEGGVLTITLNSPETRNVLTSDKAVAEIVEAFSAAAVNPAVRAIVLTGAGPAFSAGGDLRQMRRFASGELDAAQVKQWYRQGIHRVVDAVYNVELPTIAAVNGPAIGAGCDLACMCDMRIASENATFAESFVRIGLISGDGGAWLLPRVVGQAKAMEMTFTGEAISAQEALACGLVSQVVPQAQLLGAAQALAARVARNPGAALRAAKRLMRQAENTNLAALLELSADFQALAHQTADHREALEGLLQKLASKNAAGR